MRSNFVLLAIISSTFATHLARQSLPSCAVACLANTNAGPCSSTDNACLCKDQSFINSATVCIQSSCPSSDLQAAEAAAESLCLAVGVTLTPTLARATATPTTTSHSNGAPVSTGVGVFAGTVALAIAVVL